jgi:hypothetical protein
MQFPSKLEVILDTGANASELKIVFPQLVRCFMRTELDVLVIGSVLPQKAEQSTSLAADYKAEYEIG